VDACSLGRGEERVANRGAAWVVCGLVAFDGARAADDGSDAAVIEVEGTVPWRRREHADAAAPAEAGRWTLGGGDLDGIPGAAGDPTRALQVLPGVHAPNLRSTALMVRGGAPDEMIWVVEGVPLLSPRSSGFLLSRVDGSWIQRLTLHGGSQPESAPSALAAAVHVDLLEPSDTQVEGTAEIGPFVGKALVSLPLGPKGRGNAMWIGARRTFLELPLAIASHRGWISRQQLRVQDLATKIRLEPHPAHRLTIAGMIGEGMSRSDEPLSGDDVVPHERTVTALVSARHDARISDAAELRTLIAWVDERQRVDIEAGDERSDRRERWMARSSGSVQITPSTRVTVGGEAAWTGFSIEGEFLDPRTAPPFLGVPWRRMDPPTAVLDVDQQASEISGFLRMETTRGPVRLAPGVRITGLWVDRRSTVFPEPRLSASWLGDQGTVVAGSVARLVQVARDPLDWAGPATSLLSPARVHQVDLSVQQALSPGVGARMDDWTRSFERLPAWDGPGVSAGPMGSGHAVGLDVRVMGRTDQLSFALGGGVQRVRRDAPVFVRAVEPFWSVPWSATAQVGWRSKGDRAWEVGASALVRSGVAQPLMAWEARDDAVVLTSDFTQFERAPVRGRLGARVEHRLIIARRGSISAFADVIVPVGPLGRAWIGGSLDPDTGAVIPPSRMAVRDLPVVPWLGVRMRL
jgi:hypothetical protein